MRVSSFFCMGLWYVVKEEVVKVGAKKISLQPLTCISIFMCTWRETM